MNTKLPFNKIQLRAKMRDQRRALAIHPEQWEVAKTGWAKQLRTLCDQLQPAKITAYLPMAGEADPTAFFPQTDRPIFLPRGVNQTYEFVQWTVEHRLELGPHGVLQLAGDLPKMSIALAKGQIDLWIVPGLGFDVQGNRLGLGKGYYDQFLKDARGHKVGFCWDWQLVDPWRTDPWDQPMDYIVTESRCICTKTA